MGFLNFLYNNYGAFVGYVVGASSILLICTHFLREVCYRKFGIDVCPGAAGSLTRARERRQEMLDARTAMELQETLERENQREASDRKRQERRAKYQVFLKPYTMVVCEQDFYYELRQDGDGDVETGTLSASEDVNTITSAEDDNVASSSDSPLATRENVLLTLPVTTPNGSPRRVEASCNICLMNYEVGESVIWSTRKKCAHAYHAECILAWLSRGKKRCPCCRNFFVPGQAVDDKDVIVDNTGEEEEVIQEEEVEEANVDEEVADEAAIIEEIRNSAHALVVDCEAGGDASSRRMSISPRGSLHEHQLSPEADIIAMNNTF